MNRLEYRNVERSERGAVARYEALAGKAVSPKVLYNLALSG